MNLQKCVRDILHDFGFEISRHMPAVGRPYDVLPLLVRAQLAENRPFFFVQVGANDGILADPLRKMILEHRLPGLLIEPLPDLFQRLCTNYEGQPGLIFENVAITSEPGTVPMYRVKADQAARVPASWQGLASLDRAHLLKEGVRPDQIEECAVQATTLAALYQTHGIQEISLLQVDAEGFDYQIIKWALETGILPRIISYENFHLPVRGARHQCRQLLDQKGYQFIDTGRDTIAVRVLDGG